MSGQPAIILMEHELQHILDKIAKNAAREVIDAFKAELTSDPAEAVTRRLSAYIEDRSTIPNPREHWANGLHIRGIKKGASGKPRSISWFQQFKIKSGLDGCFSRKSMAAGGTKEWCFEDIANAWEQIRF